MELTLEQALQKGIEAHKAGKVQEADQYYTAILKANSKHPDANHNMGVLAVGVSKVQEALPFFKTALEANPNIAQYWLSYVDALIKLDRLDDAKAVFDQAKSKGAKGDAFDQIEKRLGSTPAKNSNTQEPPQKELSSLISVYRQGQYQEVLNLASQLLKDFPNSPKLYNTIGAANRGVGNHEEAIKAYNKALSIQPNYAEAYYNIGNVFKEQAKLEKAIDAYSRAISIKPDYADASFSFANALRGTVFKKPNKDLQNIIAHLLNKETYIRPKDISKTAISLLKFEPALQKHLKVADTGLIESPLEVISDLSKLSLLLKLMSVCPLPDLELERLLKNLRCCIITNISSLKEASPELIEFQTALALQCFTNEYIYSHTEEEEKILKSLDSSVKKDLKNNNQPSPQIVLALASYKALNKYEWCSLLVVTDDIKEVFTRQVEEPNEEEKIKQDLPILEEITNSISSEVREQYEESPYPRWVNLGLSLKPILIPEMVDGLNLRLNNSKITEVKKPEILIAGCGTGQHSIGTAKVFKSSNVLAIDLSLSSLAYAKRKTLELGIENIEYMQADILDLGQLNKQFDIIESAGVLHHMDNPMAGWKVLTDCLKPGGLMKIGLYSELARIDIIKIREEISHLGIRLSNTEMRSFRDMILKSDKSYHQQILRLDDFYSLSNLRDLLFHVQEHRFTIPQIKGYLSELGLKFCGFEVKKIVSHFKQTNAHQNDPYSLDKWQAYEEANPRAFIGMYQFWCQKIS